MSDYAAKLSALALYRRFRFFCTSLGYIREVYVWLDLLHLEIYALTMKKGLDLFVETKFRMVTLFGSWT